MKKQISMLAALIICICFIAVGCAASKFDSNGERDPDYSFEDSELGLDMNGGTSLDGNSENTALDNSLANRKIVRNAELTIQTLEYDEFIVSLNQRIAEFGGYVSNSFSEGKPIGNKNGMRYANVVAQIPAENLDEFLSDVGSICNIIKSSENVDDITTAYVDTEAHIEALRAEYEALVSLLEKSQSVDEILTLQDRISDVRYEIESYERIIRSYDNQVSFSTVTMYINEVERETPVEEETFGEEVSRRFSESINTICLGFVDFAIWFLGNLPVILMWMIIIGGIVVLVVHLSRKNKPRARRTKASRQNMHRSDDTSNDADRQSDMK